MHFVYNTLELEHLAQAVLIEYDGGASIMNRQPLDVDAFAELHLGATIDFCCLSADQKTHGLTALTDGAVAVWDPASGSQQLVRARKKTIFLDTEADANEARRRFTLAHECSHIILHRPLEADFTPEENAPIRSADPNFELRKRSNAADPQREYGFREWQANHLAAALLMPAAAVINMRTEMSKEHFLDVAMNPLHQRVMNSFGVSYTAANARLNFLKNYTLA